VNPTPKPTFAPTSELLADPFTLEVWQPKQAARRINLYIYTYAIFFIVYFLFFLGATNNLNISHIINIELL
jgi:hypothetical protein